MPRAPAVAPARAHSAGPSLFPALARTTASGSMHAAIPVVSHVTHDARAPAAGEGAFPAEQGRMQRA